MVAVLEVGCLRSGLPCKEFVDLCVSECGPLCNSVWTSV